MNKGSRIEDFDAVVKPKVENDALTDNFVRSGENNISSDKKTKEAQ